MYSIFCGHLQSFPSLTLETACEYWRTRRFSNGEGPKCCNLLCSFPRGCSSIARMTLLSKTKYRKLCLFMVGSLEYLIKVVSFTRLQGEAGPLGEGNAPSNCIILWRMQKITVNTQSKILSLPHASMCSSALWILSDQSHASSLQIRVTPCGGHSGVWSRFLPPSLKAPVPRDGGHNFQLHPSLGLALRPRRSTSPQITTLSGTAHRQQKGYMAVSSPIPAPKISVAPASA